MLKTDIMHADAQPSWKILTTPSNNYNPGALAHHKAAVIDNYAFIIGGVKKNSQPNTGIFKFNLKTLAWEAAIQKGDVPGPREDHTCSEYKDSIVLFGGYEHGNRTNDVYCLKVDTMTWKKRLA